MDLPIDGVGPKGVGNMTRLQGSGSTYTYGTRYLLVGVFGVELADDDDGRMGAVGPGAERISESQAADIESLMDEVGADRGRFITFIKESVGVDKVADIPVAAHKRVVAMLEQKRRRGA